MVDTDSVKTNGDAPLISSLQIFIVHIPLHNTPDDPLCAND
jgi:hypothetical protein